MTPRLSASVMSASFLTAGHAHSHRRPQAYSKGRQKADLPFHLCKVCWAQRGIQGWLLVQGGVAWLAVDHMLHAAAAPLHAEAQSVEDGGLLLCPPANLLSTIEGVSIHQHHRVPLSQRQPLMCKKAQNLRSSQLSWLSTSYLDYVPSDVPFSCTVNISCQSPCDGTSFEGP